MVKLIIDGGGIASTYADGLAQMAVPAFSVESIISSKRIARIHLNVGLARGYTTHNFPDRAVC